MAIKIDPYLTDEPSIAPTTPGTALVRLSQIAGALRGEGRNANSVPDHLEAIVTAREALLQALEKGTNLSSALSAAQDSIRRLYAAVATSNGGGAGLTDLGFPSPERGEDDWVEPVDTSTIVVTHFKPVRQVFSTIAFSDAHGATAYWLHEIRTLRGERLDDQVVESYSPIFTRVRLPVGPHTFIIESRNPHQSARSREFTFEVPAL